MEVKKAKEIVAALANGVDPYTGEIFAVESPYQDIDTARALYLALKSLDMYERRKQREKSLPGNAGTPWKSDEDQDLLKSFDNGKTIKELSAEHGRTEGAIRSRLIKHGRLTI